MEEGQDVVVTTEKKGPISLEIGFLELKSQSDFLRALRLHFQAVEANEKGKPGKSQVLHFEHTAYSSLSGG